MPKVSLYNAQGEKSGQIDLKETIFGVTPKAELVHQVYVALRGREREPWAHTKTRGEVSGGGKKPWKQKGTGRARQGSIRSPLWVGGGIVFGPRKDRNYAQKINKKMGKKAVSMCLSDKVKGDVFVAVDALPEGGTAKAFVVFRAKLPGADKNTLLIVSERDEQLLRATRNLKKLDVRRAMDVNVVDLLHHSYIVASQSAIAVLEDRLG